MKVVFAIIFASLLLFGCTQQNPAPSSGANVQQSAPAAVGPNISHHCAYSEATSTGVGYGISIQCTFINSGQQEGEGCAAAVIREGGSIVKRERVCASVPASDSAKNESFIPLDSSKSYTVEVE